MNDEGQKPPQPAGPVPTTPVKPGRKKSGPRVIVNFEGYTDLYDKLVAQAHESTRQPGEQALFLLKEALCPKKPEIKK